MRSIKPLFSRSVKATAIVLALLGLAGCKSIGPRTLPRDRFSYSAALAESWKNQMLARITIPAQ